MSPSGERAAGHGRFGAVRLGDGPVVTRMGCAAVAPAGGAEAGRAVLRRALRLGITYFEVGAGAGDLVREALHPYPREVVLAVTVGAAEGAHARPESLRGQVERMLRVLDADRIGLVHLRAADGVPVRESFGALADLCAAGLVGRLGLRGAGVEEIADACAVAPVAAVHRDVFPGPRGPRRFARAGRDDDVLELCENEGIAFAVSSPLAPGSLSPSALAVLDGVAARYEATRAQIALAWLLCRSRATLAVPAAADPARLRELVCGADHLLDPEDLTVLDGLR
ncbi:aryl-alcohol dehydrogenase-like predicted oxidoreductase [Actinocorallia herbida]|uniref:Aryl-alcohol dehydrogenase-like predicted oxidoreductase n=1 Tax=Actinocorallia herbida TaxID=58109 RepID=A0A3N1CYU0_9ACTN|nr:aldo/keto reductase [Actinocorallia herbida]ROO86454.1 aryl-alcohol dehydrogenase-like predicted oxidoreductase [Actinocorallia herbida]